MDEIIGLIVRVTETFFNGLFGKLLEEANLKVILSLLVVTWIANNVVRWAVENDKSWAGWVTEQRRKFGIPLAPYIFASIYYLLFTLPDPLTIRAIGAQCGEGFIQGSFTVAAYEFWTRCLHDWMVKIAKAILKKWGIT